MKLCTFFRDAAPRVGVLTDDGIVDLSESTPELPAEMTALLAAGEPALRRAAAAASAAPSTGEDAQYGGGCRTRRAIPWGRV
jgi:hypothetical protein